MFNAWEIEDIQSARINDDCLIEVLVQRVLSHFNTSLIFSSKMSMNIKIKLKRYTNFQIEKSIIKDYQSFLCNV